MSEQKEGYLESLDPGLRRAYEFAHEKVDPALVDHSRVRMRKDAIQLSGDACFYTLQGEGPTIGLPAVFVRLHVCNLRCTWCDAWYTWNPHTPEFWTESHFASFEELANQIKEAWQAPEGVEKRVIWTGGEPLIQRKQIDEVMEFLPDWEMEIETNGTLMPTEYQLYSARFNVSPKLANSDNQHHSMVRPKILEALNAVESSFKFVCMTEADLDEIEEKYLPHIYHSKIIIMPQGILEEEVSMNAKVLVEPCKERGYRLLPRLQNILWNGARRGV